MQRSRWGGRRGERRRAAWRHGRRCAHPAGRLREIVAQGGNRGAITENCKDWFSKARRIGVTTLDYDNEEIAIDRTPVERRLFESYRYAQKTCANIEKARIDDSPSGNGNTVKDLAEVVRDAPVTVYTRVQEYHLAKIRPLVKLRRQLTRDERALVVVTLFNGLLLSAGLRLGEPATLRVGLHLPTDFDVGDRFTLRHTDRKNRRRHPFTFREDFLPSWFLEFYRELVWPALLAIQGLGATPYPWLFLNPYTGRPYVNEDEGTHGERRNKVTRRDRTRHLGRLWRRSIGDACRELGVRLPHTPQTVTPHCVRNVVGNEIFQKLGQAATAAFLGDREESVVGVYGVLDGTGVDSSEVMRGTRASADERGG